MKEQLRQGFKLLAPAASKRCKFSGSSGDAKTEDIKLRNSQGGMVTGDVDMMGSSNRSCENCYDVEHRSLYVASILTCALSRWQSSA